TFAQLLLFHVFSFKIVGYFYPLVMFCLISIYPLARFTPENAGVASQPLADFLKGRAARSTYVLLAVFGLLQIFPAFFPGDSALTGEGRWLALHMFDAKVECEAYAVLKKGSGEEKRVELLLNLPVRIRCDPLVYFDRARYLCSLRRPDQGFADFDLFLNSRRTSEPSLRPLIQVQNFCTSGLHYDMWRHNGWLLAVPCPRKIYLGFLWMD